MGVRAAAAALVTLALSAGACGGDDGAGDTTKIRVLAAASLTDAFAEVAEAFEASDDRVRVELGFGASSSLREQILAGAPADVFASANPSNMDQVGEAGAASESRVFTRNRLQIVTPRGNPAGIEGLDDFADGDLLLGLCATEVPCGALAREALARAGVEAAIDTEAPDARALLTQVASGDLDAGIVYRTDVPAAGDAVEGVDIPTELNAVTDYLIAVLTDARSPERAEAFVAFVLGREGQAILARHGFEAP